MTKEQADRIVALLEQARDENTVSAKDAALRFVLTNDGQAQRTALTDHAAAEAYGNALAVIDSIIHPEAE